MVASLFYGISLHFMTHHHKELIKLFDMFKWSPLLNIKFSDCCVIQTKVLSGLQGRTASSQGSLIKSKLWQYMQRIWGKSVR